MRYGVVRLASVILVILLSAAPSARAADSPTEREEFSGTWHYAGDAAEKQQRSETIEKATEDVPGLFRGKARRRLAERTAPVRELGLIVEDDTVEIAGDDGKLSLRFGAEPIEVERDGRRGRASVRFDSGRIVFVMEGDKGKRQTTYELSPDRKKLTLSVRVTAKRLSAPLVFPLTYRRVNDPKRP